jgi:uncharacterized protein YdaU (DUF1376 family)
MRSPPAFQFYADDFIGGTCDLSASDVGAYIRLLCYQWSRGAIPSDAEKLERVAGVKVSADVLAKFPDGKNARMESEREKQSAFREEQSRKGRAGADARWKNGTGNAPAMAQAMPRPSPGHWPNDGSPSPSPSPIKHDIERGVAERPSLKEVKTYAAQIGLGPWKAEDWFHEMEGCGWLDFNHRPVAKWKPLLLRVKTKWEADGRPTAPPSAKVSPASNGAQRGPSPFGPPLAEVKEYAREKDDGTGRAVANALHWWGFWEKRNWKKKDGRSVDWKVELSAHLANSVGRHGVQDG